MFRFVSLCAVWQMPLWFLLLSLPVQFRKINSYQPPKARKVSRVDLKALKNNILLLPGVWHTHRYICKMIKFSHTVSTSLIKYKLWFPGRNYRNKSCWGKPENYSLGNHDYLNYLIYKLRKFILVLLLKSPIQILKW